MDAFLHSFLRYCLIFGIYVKASSEQDNNKNNRPKWLRSLGSVYPWLIMVCIFWSALYAVLQWRFDEGFLLSNLVATVVFVGQNAAHCMVLLEAVLKREKHMLFCQKLAEVEESLWLRLRQRVTHEERVQHIRLKYSVLTIISALGIFVFSYFGNRFFWQGLVAILTMRLRILQLSLYVDHMRLYLAALNWKLQQLVARKCDAPHFQLLDVNYKPLESIAYLQAVKQIYALLHDACQLLNDFGGWSLFAIIACYFLDFTCHVYWTLLALEGLMSLDTYISALATLLPLGTVVVTLCRACNDCKRGSILFSQLINRLINTTAACKPLYKSFIFEFSLQLRHQPLEITAKQVFSIDTQLIISICVAIATYLIVLIQFLKGEKSINTI